MRNWIFASTFAFIGCGATLALVGKPTSSQRIEPKAAALEAPKVETARLFFGPVNLYRASDEAAKPAAQPVPVEWPEVQKPKATKRVAAVGGPRPHPAVAANEKPKSKRTPKVQTQARSSDPSPQRPLGR